jgi:putative endonuclease
MDKTAKGKKGEEQAAAALRAAGMEIIAKNFRCGGGEVDLVALDGETVVFIEVKAWSAYGPESLEYALDIKKKQKIIKTAKYFLMENRKYNSMAIRFDVVFVRNKRDESCEVTHLASAFTERV